MNIVHPIVELPSCPRERLTMKWSSPKNAQVIIICAGDSFNCTYELIIAMIALN